MLLRLITFTILSTILFTSCKPIEIGQQSDVADPSSYVVKSGELSNDEIWSNKILVQKDVIVPKGVLLTIQPKTIVKFASNTKLIVHGTLVANGEANKAVTMTSNEPEPKPGDWAGIIFTQSSQNSKIEYCVIQFHNQVLCQSDYVRIRQSIIAEGGSVGIIFESASASIEDCMVTKNQIGILCDKSAYPTIEHNAITSNLTDGIVCKGASYPTISYNVINNNRKNGIYCCEASSPQIAFNNIMYNGSWAVYGGGKLTSNFIRGNKEQGMDAIDTSDNLSSSQFQGVESLDSPRSSPVLEAGIRKEEDWY